MPKPKRFVYILKSVQNPEEISRLMRVGWTRRDAPPHRVSD
jgi:hypothetical protein